MRAPPLGYCFVIVLDRGPTGIVWCFIFRNFFVRNFEGNFLLSFYGAQGGIVRIYKEIMCCGVPDPT